MSEPRCVCGAIRLIKPVKQPPKEILPKCRIIRHLLIKFEVGVHHVLNEIIDNVIEGHFHVFFRIDPHACPKGLVNSQILFQKANEHLVLFTEICAIPIVEFFDDLGKGLNVLGRGYLRPLWSERPPSCPELL